MNGMDDSNDMRPEEVSEIGVGREASESYSKSMGCLKCLVKHLSKASIEYSEYLEDKSRTTELSLALGDAACAEDHASALGFERTKSDLRRIRDRMWGDDGLLPGELSGMAAAFANRMLSSREGERARMAARMTVMRPSPRPPAVPADTEPKPETQAR